MGQLAPLEEQHHDQTFVIVSGSRACWSPRVNTPDNPAEELDALADAQGLSKGSNFGSNEASTHLEALTPPFVPLPANDFYIKFMKVFMETTQD